jgi:hypothetical protein
MVGVSSYRVKTGGGVLCTLMKTVPNPVALLEVIA